MKKIIFLTLLTLGFMVSCNVKKAEAQAPLQLFKAANATSIATSTANSADTITNGGTTYFTNKLNTLAGSIASNYVVTFQLDTTVYSGAPTYNAYLYGSMDGVTWFLLNGAPLGTDGRNCDTLNSVTFTDLTQRFSATSRTARTIYGTTSYSLCSKVNYVQLRVTQSAGAGTSARIRNVYLYTSY